MPETTVLGLQPGDVFVHRNIANILHPGDLNALSVITYAVVHLKVQDIVVCGHTSCGGANAALGNQKLGVLDAWLLPLRALRKQHAKQWEALGAKEKITKLVEANVLQGVQTLRENADVIDAVRERGLRLHGLVYDVGCGELKELEVGESEDETRLRMSAFETEAEGKKEEVKKDEEKEKEVSHREKERAGRGGRGHGE